MALPDYGSGGQWQPFSPQAAGFNRRQWRDLRPQRRRRIRNNWPAPPQAPAPEPTPEPYEAPQFNNYYGGAVPANTNLSGHPFFDPNNSYASSGRSPMQFGEDSLAYMTYATNQTPEGYYFATLNQQGLGGLDARSQAAQSLYGEYARGYQAAKLKNAELWWPEFMRGQNIRGTLDLMSNEQLGIDNSRIQGRDRWSFRSQ